MTLKASGADGKLEWIKSSYSTADGPDCVEVATAPAHILVRDSKAPGGPRLILTPHHMGGLPTVRSRALTE